MISLSGVIPYSRSSLAIAGVLSPVPVTEGQTEAVQPSAEALRFFIGGSWPQPVISPVRSSETRQGQATLAKSCIFGDNRVRVMSELQLAFSEWRGRTLG
jgi:hypothetical protein